MGWDLAAAGAYHKPGHLQCAPSNALAFDISTFDAPAFAAPTPDVSARKQMAFNLPAGHAMCCRMDMNPAPAFSVSDRAAERVAEIVAAQGKPAALRVAVLAGEEDTAGEGGVR